MGEETASCTSKRVLMITGNVDDRDDRAKLIASDRGLRPAQGMRQRTTIAQAALHRAAHHLEMPRTS